MKIERVEVFGVAVPLVGEYKNAYRAKTVQKSALVRITVTGGAVGLGNIDPSPGYSKETIEDNLVALQARLAPAVIGMDPTNIHRLYERLEPALDSFLDAKAAIEMACVDLTSRACGVLRLCEQSDSCLIDSISLRNLEILQSIRGRPGDPTLFTRLNLTKTPMGSRLLRQWLSAPLVSVEKINDRLDAVEFFYHNTASRTQSREILDKTPDIERIAGRIACGNATPRDLLALGRALATLPSLWAVFSGEKGLPSFLDLALAEPGDVSWMRDLIGQAVTEEAPAVIRNGGMIHGGSRVQD